MAETTIAISLTRYELQSLMSKLGEDLAKWTRSSPGYWDREVPERMAHLAGRIGVVAAAEAAFDEVRNG